MNKNPETKYAADKLCELLLKLSKPKPRKTLVDFYFGKGVYPADMDEWASSMPYRDRSLDFND